MPDIDPKGMSCPAPLSRYSRVQLAHGGGGRLSQQLIEGLFVEALANPTLNQLHDGAELKIGSQRLAFSTDSFVIRPIFFPGGDIGSLAVHGTVNDLSMCGAKPLALSLSFILEEGFPIEDLRRITASIARAAQEAETPIVTGDTKVVDRGKGDGVYVNTSGVGLIPAEIDIQPQRARPGDKVLVSGYIADHGIAVMCVREGLEMETELVSDSAPLCGLVAGLLERCGNAVHVLRDPTRGGVATTLCEIAKSAELGIQLSERSLPVRDAVRGACEILGLDPLYVANEGKCLVIVDPSEADAALEALRSHPYGRDACVIGEVTAEQPGRVVARSSIGIDRPIDMLSGEQLPRIC